MSRWEKEFLGEIADIKLSNVDKKSKSNERQIRLCNYTDVYKNPFINSHKSIGFMVSTCSENEYVKFRLRKNQVAITKDSEKPDDIGIPTYIKEDFDDVVLGYHLALFTPKSEELDGEFLYFWLNTKQAKRYFENNAGGSGQRCSLSLNVLKEIPLLLPEIKEQKSIAKVLSDLDAKIELNNRINRELEQMARTLYDYWFVQFDFPDGDGRPYKSSGGKMVYNQELKREIPVGWEVKELGDITSFISRGISPKYLDEGGVCVLNQKCIRNNTVNYCDARRNDNLKRNAEAKRVFLYDVLVNSTGVGTLGRVAIINRLNEKFVTVDSHVTIVRANEEIINKFYFGFSLIKKQLEIERFANGSTGQVELSRAQLESLKVIVPNNDTQIRYEIIYKKNLERMASNTDENQHLSSLRDWLLPMLMNGQVTVPGVYEMKKDVAGEDLSLAAEEGIDYKSNL